MSDEEDYKKWINKRNYIYDSFYNETYLNGLTVSIYSESEEAWLAACEIKNKEIKLLKEELKREREGNDFYDENFGGNEGKYTRISPEDWYKRGDATYGGKKAREIIAQRKIKSEDL